MRERPMYNEEQKRAFIEETITNDKTKKNAISLFRGTAPYEKEWGADLSTKTAEELSPMVEQVCGLRVRSKYTKVVVLRNYMRWCVSKGFAGAKELDERINYLDTSRSRTDLVRGPEHLQQLLNQVFDPESEETFDNVYRCYLWMAFGGMLEETAFLLTADDIDFMYMEARKGDEVAILYRQGLPSVRNCVTLDSFQYKNKTYTKTGSIRRNRVPGNRLLRGMRKDQTMMNFRSQYSRKRASLRADGIDTSALTYDRVWLSGMFYRIYEGEQAGIEPDFRSIILSGPAWKNTVKNSPDYQVQRTIAALANDLQLDYARWKLVVSSV